MPKKKKKEEEVKKKSDLKRLGFFVEDGYLPLEPPPNPWPFNLDAHAGKQFLCPGRHIADGTNLGYFTRFLRGFYNDVYVEEHRNYRRMKSTSRRQRDAPDFEIPRAVYTYPPIPSMSPLTRPKDEMISLYMTPYEHKFVFRYPSPGQKGRDYGTFSPYPLAFPPEYYSTITDYRDYAKDDRARLVTRLFHVNFLPTFFNENPWQCDEKCLPLKPETGVKKKKVLYAKFYIFDEDPFRIPGPGKKLGGMKAGCFTPFSAFRTYPPRQKKKPKPTKVGTDLMKPYETTTYRRVSTRTESVIGKNVNKYVTPSNYRKFSSGVVYTKPGGTTVQRKR